MSNETFRSKILKTAGMGITTKFMEGVRLATEDRISPVTLKGVHPPPKFKYHQDFKPYYKLDDPIPQHETKE